MRVYRGQKQCSLLIKAFVFVQLLIAGCSESGNQPEASAQVINGQLPSSEQENQTAPSNKFKRAPAGCPLIAYEPIIAVNIDSSKPLPKYLGVQFNGVGIDLCIKNDEVRLDYHISMTNITPAGVTAIRASMTRFAGQNIKQYFKDGFSSPKGVKTVDFVLFGRDDCSEPATTIVEGTFDIVWQYATPNSQECGGSYQGFIDLSI